jgi:hypothetical protein
LEIYFVVLLTAILVAAALRHVAHVNAGLTRSEILVGALTVVFSAALLTLILRLGQRSW